MSKYEKDLRKWIRRHGHIANTRLERLQKSGKQQSSHAYTYISSRLPDRYDLTRVNANGYLQFDLSTKGKDIHYLEHLKSIINKYNTAKTSSISGVKTVYNKAYKGYLKNNANAVLSYEEWRKMVSNQNWNDFKQKYGSDQFVKIVRKYDTQTALDLLSSQAVEESHSIRQLQAEAKDVYMSKAYDNAIKNSNLSMQYRDFKKEARNINFDDIRQAVNTSNWQSIIDEQGHLIYEDKTN